jgi:hypothetical protein
MPIDAETKKRFVSAAEAAGHICIEYASSSYNGPAVKCLIEQVKRLQEEIQMPVSYDQWDEKFIMVFPSVVLHE